MEGVTVYDHVPECHVTFEIRGDEIPISTIELPEGRFQRFLDISHKPPLQSQTVRKKSQISCSVLYNANWFLHSWQILTRR